MHAIAFQLKVIIVVAKILATILAIPGHSQPACQSWQLYSQLINIHGRSLKTNKLVLYVAITSQLLSNIYNLLSFTCLHTSLFVQKGLLFGDFCVMNTIHTSDTNKFTQRKQVGYYIIGTVLSYVKLFLMFPRIDLLLLLCTNTCIQLVQVESQLEQGVCPNSLNPPGYGPDNQSLLLFKFKKFVIHFTMQFHQIIYT